MAISLLQNYINGISDLQLVLAREDSIWWSSWPIPANIFFSHSPSISLSQINPGFPSMYLYNCTQPLPAAWSGCPTNTTFSISSNPSVICWTSQHPLIIMKPAICLDCSSAKHFWHHLCELLASLTAERLSWVKTLCCCYSCAGQHSLNQIHVSWFKKRNEAHMHSWVCGDREMEFLNLP